VSRFLVPIFFVYGLYLIITGSFSPGGAFGGGIALGVAVFLIILAREENESWIFDLRWVHTSFALGFSLIIFAASLSLLLGGSFLDIKIVVGVGKLIKFPLILLFEVGTGIIVSCGCIIIFGEMLKPFDNYWISEP
jgi:multisubunit Na+/H+ antiporter MnhB subunit